MMSETYEEIVRKWYLKLRPQFTELLMQRYRGTSMRLADAENIYQDVFLAIHRNLAEGRIKADTSWASYILTVGLNMAGKAYRHMSLNFSIDETESEESEILSERAQRAARALDLTAAATCDGQDDLTGSEEAREILSEELGHLPEPCASIISMRYCEGLKDKEIAEILPPYNSNGKPAETNAKAIKARRFLCMRDLTYRVKKSLYYAGLIDEKPEKMTRNA